MAMVAELASLSLADLVSQTQLLLTIAYIIMDFDFMLQFGLNFTSS